MKSLALVLLATSVSGQVVRGNVRDSASATPISGSVVILVNAAGQPIARTLSTRAGDFILPRAAGAARIRSIHIGFRPVDMPLAPFDASDTTRVDIRMGRLPTLLEPVTVSSHGCPRANDRRSAIALLEQARAALLASVVARESKLGSITVYAFRRDLREAGEEIERQSVRTASLDDVARSFVATRHGEEFASGGFVGEAADGHQVFYAPDAETLLDDAFIQAYCFRLIMPPASRMNQLGLAFSPASRRRDRVDIDGVLWIDTLARRLRDLEFKYIGLDGRVERHGPNGAISFAEMPNGVVIVNSWRLRLIGSRLDSVPRITARRVDTTERLVVFAEEVGGDVARAEWGQGDIWVGSLGSLSLVAKTRSGSVAGSSILDIPETPYRGTTNSSGTLHVRDVVPGPYEVMVADPRLTELGIEIPTGLRVVAVRDSNVSATAIVPSAEEYVVDRCIADRRHGPVDTLLIFARVMTKGGRPLQGARWAISKPLGPADAAAAWKDIRHGGVTGSDGLLQFCSDQVALHQTIRITVNVDGFRQLERVFQPTELLTVLRIEMDPNRK